MKSSPRRRDRAPALGSVSRPSPERLATDEMRRKGSFVLSPGGGRSRPERALPGYASGSSLVLGSSPSTPKLRNLIAALWEDGRVFSPDNIRCMHLFMPHLDRAMRLQMQLNSADLRAGRVSGVLDRLTLGVVLVEDSGRPAWLNRRAQEIVNSRVHCGSRPAGSLGSVRQIPGLCAKPSTRPFPRGPSVSWRSGAAEI
jgi:hypothetical protein